VLTGDSDKVKELIRSKDWPGVKTQIEEYVIPRNLLKNLMAMAPGLFEKTALFADPSQDYKCIERKYLPVTEMSVDEIIEIIKQNRGRFL